MTTTLKRTVIDAVALTVVLLASMFTGLIGVVAMTGPMGYVDGKEHTVVEVSMFDQIGYSFGGTSPDKPGGWFVPMR